ncbi:MAG: DMT family transporter [Thermodesulfobacteriota bacterium]
MDPKTAASDFLLLTTAVIWGFAFVAQRVGMEYIGPFAFNGIRFALGCAVLLPLLIRDLRRTPPPGRTSALPAHRSLLPGGIAAGIFLFGGASFQQVGMVYTTAGNAGFITGLYVVIVPVIGLFTGQRSSTGIWLGALLSAIGLYLLSITGEFTISRGDFLVLMGAFVWAAHVLFIGWFAPKTSPLRLAFAQFAVCSILSLAVAAVRETFSVPSILQAALPLAYGGLLSVGVAYTLQVVAQKSAHPAHAAILLSLEAVFAAIGGRLILEESMTTRAIIGCAFMLAGMLISQLWGWWWFHLRETDNRH